MVSTRVSAPVLAALRLRLQGLDGVARRRAVLPFGVPEIDVRLPDGGLALGALHEVIGGGNGAIDGAAAALFAAGIAARTQGRVLWCVTRQDLFAPALAQAGLAADRVIYVEAGNEKAALVCFEEGLRHGGGIGAVIAEVTRLSMTASRRLQLAAEGSGAIGIAIRRLSAAFFRSRGGSTPALEAGVNRHFAPPTAAVTRWRVSALPSAPLPVTGIGRARWQLELIRCRGGESACFDVEACDAQGRLAVPADVVHGPGQAATGQRRAAG
ncbi:MAG: damage-inducible protein [Bradyrhizobiaceae bacterium]|nr:damage-inducible protein [Bradyrhizobiaceae bacterium]